MNKAWTFGLLLLSLAIAGPARAQIAAAAVGADLEPWTTQDVIDERIDEYAQYALMRMFVGDLPEQAAASDMLAAVKSGDLAGIYVVDQQVAALRAQAIGKSWWTVLPKGLDAVCITEPTGKAPLIAFSKEARKDKDRLDTALINAWHMCPGMSAPLRGYRQTLPPKQPRDRACETAEGFATLQVQLFCGSPGSDEGPIYPQEVVFFRDGTVIGEQFIKRNVPYTLSGLEPGLYSVESNGMLRWFEAVGNCDYRVDFDLCGPSDRVETGHFPTEYSAARHKCFSPYMVDASQCRAKYSRDSKECRSLPSSEKEVCRAGPREERTRCLTEARDLYDECLAQLAPPGQVD